MIYLSPQPNVLIDHNADPELWGLMCTPAGHRPPLADYVAGGDNGAFTGAFNEKKFFRWLRAMLPHKERFAFITVPDVVFDAVGTYYQFLQYALQIRELGFRVALAAQNLLEASPRGVLVDWRPGPDDYTDWLEEDSDEAFWDVYQEYHCMVDWRDFDALLIGGTSEWKLGEDCREHVIKYTLDHTDKWVHVGRVNTDNRIEYFWNLGVHSVDGTRIRHAPNAEFYLLNRKLTELQARERYGTNFLHLVEEA